MSETTFAGLSLKPNAQKDFLVIAKPKERLENWTKTGGKTNVYEIAWANIYTVSTDYGDIWRDIDKVEHDGVALDLESSTATVDANDGSYWHDSANDKLYIHTTDSSDPDSAGTFIVLFMKIYFASGLGENGKGKIFSDIYYEPIFNPRNLPGISYEQTDLFSGGGIKSGAATLSFNNPKSFWDVIYNVWTWINADFLVYFGGESLPFTEYQLIYMCQNREESWSDGQVWFDTVNYADLLKRTIPVTPLFGANVASSDTGKPIPLCIGIKTGIKPLLSDESTPDAHVYTIADASFQTLKAIDAVYDGVTTLTGGGVDYNVDLANCKFTMATYTPSGEITCDVKGAKISDITGEASTDLMTLAGDIVKFLLITILGRASTDLNSTSFAASRIANDFGLSKYIRYKRNMASYIAEIERSVLGNFYIDNDGLFAFDIYEPILIEDDSLIEEEMTSFVQTSPISRRFAGIKIYHNPMPYTRDETSPVSEGGEEDTYEVVEGTNDRANYLDGLKNKFKNIYTWISSSTDATIHLQRLLLMTDVPVIQVDTISKGIKLFQRRPGDILKISRSKAGTASGDMSNVGFQILKIVKDVSQNQSVLVLDNLKGLGLAIGMWTLDTAPDWSTATDAEKEESGFYCDATGYCDPTDLTSLNKSLWW